MLGASHNLRSGGANNEYLHKEQILRRSGSHCLARYDKRRDEVSNPITSVGLDWVVRSVSVYEPASQISQESM